MRRRRRQGLDEVSGQRKREPKPLRLYYDLDWRPPPPTPELMRGPVGDAPRYKNAVKLTVTELDLDREFRGERRGRLKLSTGDGMEYVYLSLSPNMHVTFVNDLFKALINLPPKSEEHRRGFIDEGSMLQWVGRTALFDLVWSTWDQGAAWTVKKMYPLPTGD